MVRLDRYQFMSIDLDVEARRLSFIPCGEDVPHDARWTLQRDGGKTTEVRDSRITYIRKGMVPDLCAGRYAVKIQNTSNMLIDLEPCLFDAPYVQRASDVPSNTIGIYCLRDTNDDVLDIGMSSDDIRTRLQVKWSSENASSAQFVALKSAKDCKHWERHYHKKHASRAGALPTHNLVFGPGCGCDECEAPLPQVAPKSK